MTPSSVERDESRARDARWALIAFLVAVVLGGAQAIANRFYMNPDGVSYLDLGDAYARGDYAGAVNAYWSPVYPWLLGLMQRLGAWDPYWESSRVHALNFAIFLVSFGCFLYMFHQLRELQQARIATGKTGIVSLARSSERLAAIVLFLWAGLALISVIHVTPDMMIAAETYLIAGIMLRSLRGPVPRYHPPILGALLGLSYLTKSIMFPVSFLVIASVGWGKGAARWTVRMRLACLALFLMVAAPQIIAISRKYGHVTFGDNGRIAYATYVNKYPVFWMGDPPGSGTPVHPIRRILADPDAHEYPSPGTTFAYPFWGDPAYWDQGMQPHFNFSQQIAATKKQLQQYSSFLSLAFLACLGLGLMSVAAKRRELITLSIPGGGVLLLYALVYVEPRYVAASVVVLMLCLFCFLEFGKESNPLRSPHAVMVAFSICVALSLATAFRGTINEAGRILTGTGSPNESWSIAAQARNAGLMPGQKVAFIGRGFDAYWARLARVQIAMEIPETNSARFWASNEADRTKALGAFAAHGAEAVVANGVPEGSADASWQRLGYSSFLVRLSR